MASWRAANPFGFVGEWIYRPLELPKVHPGYFLPSVAGGFVASAALAGVGQTGLATLLFGTGLLMIAAQLRLLPVYLRLSFLPSFLPSFWSFTFSWAAVVFAGESWLAVTRPAGWQIEFWILLVVITTFIGAIAMRTLVALRDGELLPGASASPPAGPGQASGATTPILVSGS